LVVTDKNSALPFHLVPTSGNDASDPNASSRIELFLMFRDHNTFVFKQSADFESRFPAPAGKASSIS